MDLLMNYDNFEEFIITFTIVKITTKAQQSFTGEKERAKDEE